MWHGFAEVYGLDGISELYVSGQIIQKQGLIHQIRNEAGTVKYIYVFQPTKIFAHHDVFGTTSNFALGIY